MFKNRRILCLTDGKDNKSSNSSFEVAKFLAVIISTYYITVIFFSLKK